MSLTTRKAIFLDRDGVVNLDRGYVHLREQVAFTPGIFEFCKQAKAKGYLLIVVTNQSGIGRGLFDEAAHEVLKRWMQAEFEKQGCALDAYYHCPHAPEAGCACRKPKPGMILQAVKEWNIDLPQSILIGDNDRDIEAGKAAGVGKTELFIGKFPKLT